MPATPVIGTTTTPGTGLATPSSAVPAGTGQIGVVHLGGSGSGKATTPKPATTTTPAPATSAGADTVGATSSAPSSAADRLAARMQRIEEHATRVETLKNGAKLYHLPGGRLVEQVPGKSPYVVAAGDKTMWHRAS